MYPFESTIEATAETGKINLCDVTARTSAEHVVNLLTNTDKSAYILPEPCVVFRVSVSPNWALMEAGDVYLALNTLVGPISSLQ